VLGDDWLAVPIYVQLTGVASGDEAIGPLCGALACLPKVQHLSLLGTRVGDKSIMRLGELRQLRVLDIRGSGFTDAGVKSLKRQLPECQILFETKNPR
jgi:hypothetical protein